MYVSCSDVKTLMFSMQTIVFLHAKLKCFYFARVMCWRWLAKHCSLFLHTHITGQKEPPHHHQQQQQRVIVKNASCGCSLMLLLFYRSSAATTRTTTNKRAIQSVWLKSVCVCVWEWERLWLYVCVWLFHFDIFNQLAQFSQIN